MESHDCSGSRSRRSGAGAEETRLREDETGQRRRREVVELAAAETRSIRNSIAAKLTSCSPTTRCAWKIPADAAILSRRILTAMTFSAIATASSTPARFGVWKQKL